MSKYQLFCLIIAFVLVSIPFQLELLAWGEGWYQTALGVAALLAAMIAPGL